MYNNDYDNYYDDEDYGGPGHTGDPMLDREYDRQFSDRDFVPDAIKRFLSYFRDMINEGNTFEVANLYENSWPKLSEEYFKSSSWPDADEIAPFVQDDNIFLILYKELYFRHIYARVNNGPNCEQRFDSYYNYCSLFNCILTSGSPVTLDLPNQWLWEIIDEFIYQFQSFVQFRAKLGKKSAEELETLRSNPRTWDVLQVLNVLHSMVDKSNINKQLEMYSAGKDPDLVAGEFGRHPLYKMMGYFSLVGLLRLHSLLGDFHQAIKVLENVELNKKSLYSRVPGCQISMYYYVGFAYMMMRRYADAIRTFSSILLYIQRTRGLFQMQTYQNAQINKQTEQMYVLLAMCLVLHPQRIDESLHSMLKEKNYADKMNKMQGGDTQTVLNEFEACFTFACPKFLSPVPPSIEGVTSPDASNMAHKEPLKLQLKVFMDEVKQQMLLPTIRSYLKLYTSMPLDKLAGYLGKSVDDLEKVLLCYKHKMRNVVWTKGVSALDGEFQSESEVDFYIDKNMIHIADTKVDRRFGDFFIRQIHKFEELNRGLKAIKL